MDNTQHEWIREVLVPDDTIVLASVGLTFRSHKSIAR